MALLHVERGNAVPVLDALERVHGCRFYLLGDKVWWYFAPSPTAARAAWAFWGASHGKPRRPEWTKYAEDALVTVTRSLRPAQ
ncbi:MAG: hypothetical protein FJX77_12210 [Armatimonadetes bacterium]|nr:hypothetical protein [Armatimonadota bacterium]